MKVLKTICAIVAFVVSMGLIIYGQSQKGIMWLGVMLIGLAGLVILLYLYNRGYTKGDKKPKESKKQ